MRRRGAGAGENASQREQVLEHVWLSLRSRGRRGFLAADAKLWRMREGAAAAGTDLEADRLNAAPRATIAAQIDGQPIELAFAGPGS